MEVRRVVEEFVRLTYSDEQFAQWRQQKEASRNPDHHDDSLISL
jgi:hypothetical protein